MRIWMIKHHLKNDDKKPADNMCGNLMENSSVWGRFVENENIFALSNR